MNQYISTANLILILHVLIQAALIVRVLLRPHREPASRIAWIVVIVSLPVLGILTYILLGETNIGRHRVERLRQIIFRLSEVTVKRLLRDVLGNGSYEIRCSKYLKVFPAPLASSLKASCLPTTLRHFFATHLRCAVTPRDRRFALMFPKGLVAALIFGATGAGLQVQH